MSAIWDYVPPNKPLGERRDIPYVVHCPTMTQLTGKNFHYFKLNLFDIQRFFPTKKSWNRDYAPAQQIYSDSPVSAALRSAISTQHSIMYSGRKCRQSVEGHLDRSPKAFFELLDNYQDEASLLSPIHSSLKAGYDLLCSPKCGVTKPKLRVYTYVLMDNNLRFSRTGAAVLVDMSSKHALHAGGAEEICYAGEFWVETPPPGATGERTLYMDNNSGTFAPPKKDLQGMAWLMKENFPGINVVVLDYQDPEWKERRRKE